jgi:imidazolonepropionase-like amidohydrolase
VVTVLRCGRLWDGTGADPVDDALVTIGEDGNLLAEPPAAGQVDEIDLSRFTVLPGLIDAHSHVSMIFPLGDTWAQKRDPDARQALRAPLNFRKDLDSGVTTARIMGEENWIDLHVREAVEAGYLEGPELVVATRPLYSSYSSGRIVDGIDGVETVRAYVRENLFRGADFIKIFATGTAPSGADKADYTDAEMAAIVDEASTGGRYVAAHAVGGPGLDSCIELGVRTIEHGWAATDDQLAAMRERDCWLVATYTVLFDDEGALSQWPPAERTARTPAWERRRADVAREAERILASGVNLALGTDTVHGAMAGEVGLAVRFGVSPRDALLAATSGNARAIQVDDRTGTLEPGKRADVIAVDGDPLEDPAALGRVVFVMLAGRRVRG